MKLAPAGHELMPSAQANVELPHLVIDFYLDRLVYSTMRPANNLTGLIDPLDGQDIAEVVGK